METAIANLLATESLGYRRAERQSQKRLAQAERAYLISRRAAVRAACEASVGKLLEMRAQGKLGEEWLRQALAYVLAAQIESELDPMVHDIGERLDDMVESALSRAMR